MLSPLNPVVDNHLQSLSRPSQTSSLASIAVHSLQPTSWCSSSSEAGADLVATEQVRCPPLRSTEQVHEPVAGWHHVPRQPRDPCVDRRGTPEGSCHRSCTRNRTEENPPGLRHAHHLHWSSVVQGAQSF